MTSGSSKEAWKALKSLFSDPSDSQDLPAEAISTIEVYVENRQEGEDYDPQSIQDELLSIYGGPVSSYKEGLPMFLQLLQLLRPCIQGQDRLEELWVKVIEPIVNGTGYKRIEIQRASDFLISLLDYDAERDDHQEHARTSSHFIDIVLSAWLKRTRVPSPEQESHTVEDQHIARQLENVLIGFGKGKAQVFFTAINHLIVSKDTRLQTLTLLSVFIRSGPPHLYTVGQTPLIENLLKSLMIDTSSTAVSLGLTNLLMLLPHIPASVKIHLPRLFLIYSRLLCWEHFRPQSQEGDDEENEEGHDEEDFEDALEETEGDLSWERLESLVDSTELTAGELLHYFTFLYGLYPLNFMSYIQKPRKYLKDIGFPRADEFDLPQALIRTRTNQFRQIHALHPNFYTTTLKDELTDDYWMKSDPAMVVSECMALCLQSSAFQERPGPPPIIKLPDIPPLNNGTTVPVNVPSDNEAHVRPDSPTLPPPVREVKPSAQNMAWLQRENLLLRSDLNFERNVKQQQLVRIGQLQRKNFKDANMEAETAGLVNTTRSLKARLQKQTEAYAALKRETQTGRNHFKNWETDITSKMRVLVEDERQWRAEEEGLRTEVRKLKKDCDLLRNLVVDRESKELLAQQKLSSFMADVEQLTTLQARVAELEDDIRKYEEKDLEYTQASDEKETLQREIADAKLQLQGSLTTQERAQKTSSARIAELQNRLRIAQEGAGDMPPTIQQKVNAIIAASDAKLQNMKKEHANLRHRYVELEMKCQELKQDASLGEIGLRAASALDIADSLGVTTHDSADKSSLLSSSTPPTSKPIPGSGLLRSGTVSSKKSVSRSLGEGETLKDPGSVAGTLYGQNSSRFSMDPVDSASGKDDKNNDAKKTRSFGRGPKLEKSNGDRGSTASSGENGTGNNIRSNGNEGEKKASTVSKTATRLVSGLRGMRGVM